MSVLIFTVIQSADDALKDEFVTRERQTWLVDGEEAGFFIASGDGHGKTAGSKSILLCEFESSSPQI